MQINQLAWSDPFDFSKLTDLLLPAPHVDRIQRGIVSMPQQQLEHPVLLHTRQVERLHALATNRFCGASQGIGVFKAELVYDSDKGKIHFMVQVGFGYWRFDKVEN